MKLQSKNMVLAGLFLAIGAILPFFFHTFGFGAGAVFLPMHLPVLLCGFVCGAPYGAVIGLVLPYLSILLTGNPPLYPTAIAMSLELCTYGAAAGLIYRRFSEIPALILAQLSGRAVSGLCNLILLGFQGKQYLLATFLTGAFVTALPGLIIQWMFCPILLAVLKKGGYLHESRCGKKLF